VTYFFTFLLFFLFSRIPFFAQESGCSANSNFIQSIEKFFQSGASGYLLWQYSGDKNSPFENDPYSFYRGDPICTSLQELKAKYPDKYLGVNIHSLAKASDSVIADHLSYLSTQCGISVVRFWGTPDRATPQKIKTVLDLAAQNHLQTIVTLADYSNGTDRILPSSIRSNPTSWYQSGYQQDYLPYARSIAQTLGGHPALKALELANEPHCNGITACVPAYNQWVNSAASAIKSVNSSIKVSIGQMASQNTTLGDSPASNYRTSNQSSSIDLASAHFYNPSEEQNALAALDQAKSLGKEFYLGEAPASCQDPCDLDHPLFPAIHISTADPSHPSTAQDPLNKHPNNHPQQTYIKICETDHEFQQTFEPQNSGSSTPPQPYTATELKQEIQKNDYTSPYSTNIATYLIPEVNSFSSKEKLRKNFTSYNTGLAYRLYPAKLQEQSRRDFLNQVVAGNQVDEQIAWDCSGQCRPLTCPKTACRPVYLSELAAHYGIASNPPVSASLSSDCYQKLFDSLNFVFSGSANSKIDIRNVTTTTGQVQSSTLDRMIPNGASLFNTLFQMAIPAKQKKLDYQSCRVVPAPPTQNTTNPLSFNFFHAISELIDSVKTVSRRVTYTESQDPRALEGLSAQKTFISNFLPNHQNQELNQLPDSSTGDKVKIDDLGGKQANDKFSTFSQWFTPYSRQKQL